MEEDTSSSSTGLSSTTSEHYVYQLPFNTFSHESDDADPEDYSGATSYDSNISRSLLGNESADFFSLVDDFSLERKLLSSKGYYIGDEIGSGTFGKVYVAQKITKNAITDLAVKVVDKTKVSKIYVKKFLPHELFLWPKLHHTSIVKLLKTFNNRRRVYMFMTLARNGSLADYIAEHTKVSEALAQKWFAMFSRGLAYCHRRGVAHRDIKSDNLLLDADGNLYISDFGFCTLCVDEVNGKRLFAKTSCGTPNYMAPEVATETKYDGLSADCYSAGIVLYEMLTGKFPFHETNVIKRVKDQLLNNWELPECINSVISDSCKNILNGLLEPIVENRLTMEKVISSAWIRKKD